VLIHIEYAPGIALDYVGRPSEEGKQTASACMKDAYNRLRLEFKHISGAAAA
jgi:hypothetical protein